MVKLVFVEGLDRRPSEGVSPPTAGALLSLFLKHHQVVGVRVAYEVASLNCRKSELSGKL
jgi:hypothetical protein